MIGQVFWLTHAVLFLLALVGFACLALSMIRHQEDLFGHALNALLTRGLRAAGWLFLLLALWLAAASMGWSFGLTVYSGHTSAAAGLAFIALLVKSHNRERKRGRR
ncbi:DUF3325 domain-containing protein [Pusillimonas sp. ANT_WB101]|uniref:DUF3325 domain-containing protein n=1 Tax=Pusillimonas sp. ANT_WB101 TaxID=2597356 RepID=UPI0011F009E1|nr:DUF3325 domain-containing protein [Pusillimonas sp. ANT_WB101]KAA0892592.1 DUF3325 domain-containing protein [Pusillimonas sp. ANT_WB101]